MEIQPIARFRSPFTSKFGIPRQSGLIDSLRGSIVMEPDYAQAEALRGLDGFDYLWIIWVFSQHVDTPKHATVRPPLLGGNERMGVWATRSPFRPNNLGLSSVRIERVDAAEATIWVRGADLMDGTPIYDLKPYLPYVDSHPEARGGFTDHHSWQPLEVELPEALACQMPPQVAESLRAVLATDPRPSYHPDDGRLYGLPFAGWEVKFSVSDGRLQVVSWSR